MGPLKWLIIILATTYTCSGQDCPLNWEQHADHCYHFVFYPLLPYVQAEAACLMDGATLISVNDDAENQFVIGYLTQVDVEKRDRWYTSGFDMGGTYVWEGDGSDVMTGDYWSFDATAMPDTTSTMDSRLSRHSKLNIIYSYSPNKLMFTWDWASKNEALRYICEISKVEAFRINRPLRDFTYGLDTTDPNQIERGPTFTSEPQSIVLTGREPLAFVECMADGKPSPSYRWFKNMGSSNETEVTKHTSERYTLTNGRLTISQPDLDIDPGDFQCIATNKIGSIVSNPVSISAGYLNEFLNDKPGAVRAPLYQGTVLNCNTPSYNPKVTFAWYKNDAFHFIRPTLNPHTFVSENGRFYISEIQSSDQGQYHCVVTLAAPYGVVLATSQPPSRNSLAIGLIVTGENANDFGPTIHNDFPAVFPNPPQRGKAVRLECLAYGRLPLTYSWKWDNGELPPGTRFENLNRVLIIDNVQLEHSGNYTCIVRRGGEASDSKTLHLSVISEPYFLFPLKNKYVDKGSQLTWRCEAISVPRATYTWLKNSKVLQSTPGDVEIRRNVLVIKNADADKHNGMYQCMAENRFGRVLSGAELRVLSFQPTFEKKPLHSSMMGTQGGNITIPCAPEAAPTPDITWYKDNRDLGLSVSQGLGSSSHMELLPTGSLVISTLTTSDSGTYKCTATNDMGSASSEGTLQVVTKTVITTPPTNTDVVVNNTAFLYCQASYNQNTNDLVYVWHFNDYLMDVEQNPDYVQGVRGGERGLYIRNAQFKHSGRYTCVAQTVQDKATAEAWVTVMGPPGEPAGVYAKQVLGRNIELRWTPGTDHGDIIQAYRVEASNNFDPTWVVIVRELPEHAANIQNLLEEDLTKRGTNIEGLGAGTSYRFRVTARNRYGWGEPSVPSTWTHIESAAPLIAPTDVGGGGGSVGLLTLNWEPLPRKDWGMNQINYTIYYRLRNTIGDGDTWIKHVIPGNQPQQFVTVVGSNNVNYYLLYEVKAQAVNSYGSGPNSTIATVYSAEGMPVGTPSNVNAQEQNATSALVFWSPVPDDRLDMRGRVLGYQINYWVEGQTYNDARFIRHYGQRTSGLIIGLQPNTNYWCNVNVFNGAGLGPKSENWWFSTYYQAPALYPEFVSVYSMGPTSVEVFWRGFSTYQDEESLRGYKLLYWKMGDDIRQAESITVGKVSSAIITGIEKSNIYKLRMMGISYGGDGKKSPTVYFTLGGQVRYDRTTSEIRAGAESWGKSPSSVFMCITIAYLVSSL